MWTIALGDRRFDPRFFETRVFDSEQAFKTQFRQGLVALLSGQLTASQVVLVANNAIAIGDLGLFEAAMARGQQFRGEQSSDGLVLDYLAKQEFPLRTIRRRTTAEGFVLVYSHLRSLRTNHLDEERRRKRERPGAVPLRMEFNPEGFNFNKVSEEKFASVYLSCGRVDLYYNKTPYYGWHVLCVPVPAHNYPQYLSFSMVSLWQQLYSEASSALPGCVMGYNSIGAYASINQLHFHLIFVDETVDDVPPVPGRREGGFGQTTADRMKVWPMVDAVQRADQPFNLVQDAGGPLLVPRRGQHLPGPDWSTGFAWFELAGGFIVICPERFEALTDAQIWAALREQVDLAA